MARAPLIAYLDDDNEYRRDHLQVLYKYLGDYDIVYGDRWLIDETGKGKDMKGISYNFDAQLLSKVNYIDTSDVLIRKECLEAVGGWDETLPKFADWNLWVRLAKAGFRFKRVPIIITNYHVHRGCNQFKHKNEVDPTTGRILPTFDPAGCKIWPDKTLYGERPKLKVAIFTLTMNRLEYTKRTYASMKKTAGYPFDWYVVDNGSTDGTVEWIGEMATKKKVKRWIPNEKNVGISKASNQALDMIQQVKGAKWKRESMHFELPKVRIPGSDDLWTLKTPWLQEEHTAHYFSAKEASQFPYDIIIKVDNDCEFITDGWLKEIVDLFERQQRMVISPRVEGLRDSPGGVPRTWYFYVAHHFLGLAPHLGGICVAAPAKIYENFRWDEHDFLHGEQDYIFSQYAISQGYMLAYMENLIVEHMDTTSGQEKKYPEYFAQRKKLKTTRYEGDTNNSG